MAGGIQSYQHEMGMGCCSCTRELMKVMDRVNPEAVKLMSTKCSGMQRQGNLILASESTARHLILQQVKLLIPLRCSEVIY